MTVASTRPVNSARGFQTATQGSTLADVLERVLDKGIVIAGDITVSVGSTELLSIRIRLLVSSVDKAREIGINWWENDPYLNSKSHQMLEANQQLQTRIESLETELRSLRAATPASQSLEGCSTQDSAMTQGGEP